LTESREICQGDAGVLPSRFVAMVVCELPPERTGRRAAGVSATVTGAAAAGAWPFAMLAEESAQGSPATAVKAVQRQFLKVIRGRAK
jgi:hypothetical protein